MNGVRELEVECISEFWRSEFYAEENGDSLFM
jgi:hypothetical protein